MIKLGIDIGGTTIKGGRFVNNILEKHSETPTNGNLGRKDILKALFKVIDDLYDKDVELIGVASAGNINNQTGECVYATDNLKGWTGINIKNEVNNRYAVECKVENDAIAALMAEASLLRNNNNVTMLTLGTGVGGASIVNNTIIRGNNFNGGRWGHVPLEINGIKCNCGNNGCSEQYLSATALYKYAKKSIPDLKDCKELFDMFRKVNNDAIKILERYAQYLNVLLKIINNALAPESLIIGGGLALSKDVLSKLIDKDINNVIFAKLKNKAGIYGASNL